uniref:Uncharacterized protein n=1 Tax=Otus sunia TaxID=257818 RepID=A0A8C8AJ99_9STRI
IIQSSQPSSLKFTCRGFLLQRVFAFFPWPLPPDRAAMVVRLFLRLGYTSWPGSGGSRKGGLPRALILSRISLKRKHSTLPEGDLSLRSRRASQTSNTSHLEEPASKMSAALESSSRGSSPSQPGQVERRRWWKVPSGDRAKLRFSGRARKTRSSAPVTSSASGRLEMSKRYRCGFSASSRVFQCPQLHHYPVLAQKAHLNLRSTAPSAITKLSPTSALSVTAPPPPAPATPSKML